jgi:hypothetical protein
MPLACLALYAQDEQVNLAGTADTGLHGSPRHATSPSAVSGKD